MVSIPPIGRRPPLGIAIGATTVEVAETGSWTPARRWSRPIEPLADGAVRWPALTEVLRELRSAHPRGRTLAVALLAPLVDVRPVTLPPLALDEARRVIARNATRHFLGARGPQLLAVAPPPRRAQAGPRPFVAAAVPVRVVEAIQAAARDAGWEVGTIVPAVAAWRAAAVAIWPRLHRGARTLVVARGDRTELLGLEDGALVSVRRFHGMSTGVSAVHEALQQDTTSPIADRVAILGPVMLRQTLASALQAQDAAIATVPAKGSAWAESPELAAAAFAWRGKALEFVPESAQQLGDARRAKALVAIAATAALFLVVAAALEWWGVRRELRYIEGERAALRSKVAALVATRTVAESAGRRLKELAAVSQTNAAWSDVVAMLTNVLPRDAYLTAFRADGDSLVLEGLASRAATVFAAIDAAPGLSDTRSAAPVRRDLRDRAAPNVPERFSIAARVAPENNPSQQSDPSQVAFVTTAREP